MKWLQKLKLINWHYFKDEEIPFGKQTMITGRNAAGKSTIIDALQVLFIANGKMIRFNSSAHDDAKRSLISYLRGKVGSEDQQYLREGDFTTYLMAEFFDEAKKIYFVIGTVVDVYKDDTVVQEYFIVDQCKIQDLDYLNEKNRLRNRDEFHRYIERLDNRSILERTKEGYQKALLSRMGQVDQRFFPTFSKALSFKPIQNVRDFVYDYILDEKELQLDIMKENFEVHQQYKKELGNLVERQNALGEINRLYEQYIRYGETIVQQDYVIRQMEHRKQQEEYGDLQIEILNLIDAMQKQEKANEKNKLALEEAKKAKDEAYLSLHSNNDKKREEKLHKDISNIQNVVKEQRAALSKLILSLKNEVEKIHSLKKLPDNNFWNWNSDTQELLSVGTVELMDAIRILESGGSPEIDLSAWGNELSELHSSFIIANSNVSKRMDEVKKQKDELKKEIRDLENQKRRYPESVEKLKRLLEEQLSHKSDVWIFCEEMELQNEDWRNAIEGYLHTQRFDLLVEPDSFEEALRIYEKEKWNLRLEGAGLVNTYKEREYLGTRKENSLATEIESHNPVIQARIEHLMGRVIKADSEKELSRHQAAITPSCMLYQNLVARQMKAERYRVPYIGSKAIPRQLELKREQLIELEKLFVQLNEYVTTFQRWLADLKDMRSLYKEMNSKLKLPQVISESISQLEKYQAELSELDFEGIKRLEENFNNWDTQVNDLDKERLKLNRSLAANEALLKGELQKIHIQERQLVETNARVQGWKEENSIDTLNEAEKRWKDAVKQTKPIEEKLFNWRRNKSGNETLRDNEFDKLKENRHGFNIKHLVTIDKDARSNEAYQHLFNQINIDISDYQTKLDEALKQSEEEFASHFVYKMKEAIEMARRQFLLLNKSLKQFPFNEESYQFEVKASDKYKRFYNVIMNLSNTDKATLFDLPDEEQNEALHELFELLTKEEGIEQQEFTDYRRYLDFDLIVTAASGSKIRFSTVLKEKSGGETQTPFYIAILSSFNQLYQSLKTVRLVVFDEAFNKMDEERIQTSLRLIKNMEFQLIAAVPDEKLANMAKEVSTIVIVHREGYECFTDMIEYTEQENGDEPIEQREKQEVSVQYSLLAAEEV